MAHAFRNLDDRTILAEDLEIIEQSNCENFAVQFNANTASSRVQVNHETVQNLLHGRAQTKDPSTCLWMNLWGWSPENKLILEAVARHFELSPRLAHSMCPSTAPTPAQRTGPTSINANSSKPAANMPRPASSMADVFEAVWHFGSVDFGHRYICLGWNALFFLPHTPKSLYGSKPNAMRVWSTVLLCDDGTVLSIFEKPLAATSDMLLRARRNQINIFKDLSSVNEAQRNALFRTAIRVTQAQYRPGSQTDMLEMASLLFYYLFDDWINLFSQVSGSEFSYRRQLELLRKETIEHPDSKQVDRVHQLGRQLSSLRSICRSYQSLIEQLLRSQTSLGQPASRSMLALNDSSSDSDFIRLPLSSMVRFARLQNRIELCAMTELDDCVSEKDSLVQMNFNLTNLREAQTVERLTRTTILLAKVTIVFLPISLATSYFSMQIPALQHTSLLTYWMTFLVVGILTVVLLIGFEGLAAHYSGQLIYKGFTRMFFETRWRPPWRRSGKRDPDSIVLGVL